MVDQLWLWVIGKGIEFGSDICSCELTILRSGHHVFPPALGPAQERPIERFRRNY